MGQKITRESLGELFRKLLAKHSNNYIETSNKFIGKPIEDLVEALVKQDQEIASEFTSEILRQLSNNGVDLSELWPGLDKQGLVDWGNEKNG